MTDAFEISFIDPGVKIYGCALPPGGSEGSEVLYEMADLQCGTVASVIYGCAILGSETVFEISHIPLQ